VEKPPAKPETKVERADREAHDQLKHADMDLFDKFMKKLIHQPPADPKPKRKS